MCNATQGRLGGVLVCSGSAQSQLGAAIGSKLCELVGVFMEAGMLSGEHSRRPFVGPFNSMLCQVEQQRSFEWSRLYSLVALKPKTPAQWLTGVTTGTLRSAKERACLH